MFQLQILILLGVLGTITFTDGAERCEVTQLTVKLKNGSTRCHDCSVCPPGQGFSHICSSETKIPESELKNLKCIPCVPGETYSALNDSTQCHTCNTCAEDEVVNQTCSVFSEAKCGKKCHSEDNYYSTITGECEPCSPCCNDKIKNTIMDECLRKGKSTSESCSIRQVSKCATSPSPVTTPAQWTNPNMSNQIANQYSSKKLPSKLYSQTPKFISIGCLASVVIAAAVVLCRKLRSRKHVEIEQGRAEEGQVNGEMKAITRNTPVVYQSSGQVNEASVTIRCTEVSGQSSTPEQDNQNPNCKMTLSEFANKKYSTFDKVCELLDMKKQGCGNYEHVAKHYGVESCTIKSRFEKDTDGPSKALFECLMADKPELTVGTFIELLRSIKRNDVANRFLNTNGQ